MRNSKELRKEDLGKKKFTPIHPRIRDIAVAVGAVFHPDIKPKVSPDAILTIGEFPSWRGKSGGPKKFYALRIKDVPVLYLPFWKEMYGEIVLFRTNRKVNFLFGRHDEIKPFTFSKEKDHLPLRLYRNGSKKGWYFKPIFIRIEKKRNKFWFYKLSVIWLGNEVILDIDGSPKDNIPSFLLD